MKKFIITILFLFLLINTSLIYGTNSEDLINSVESYHSYAEKLSRIGVFKGTDIGFELDREPTRLEGLIMFIRLLGKEEEALNYKGDHPFIDVPGWATSYIGWAYENGYTKGVADNQFGMGTMEEKSFITFILRALHYDDSRGDFSWSTAVLNAQEFGVIDDALMNEITSSQFLRGHIAKIAYDSLNCKVNGKEVTLAQQLSDNGSLQVESLEAIGLKTQKKINIQAFDDITGIYFKETTNSVYVYVVGEEIMITIPEAVYWHTGGYVKGSKAIEVIDSYIENDSIERDKKNMERIDNAVPNVTWDYEAIGVMFYNVDQEPIAFVIYDRDNLEYSEKYLIQIDIKHEPANFRKDYSDYSKIGNQESFPHIFHIERYVDGVLDEEFVCTGGSASSIGREYNNTIIGYFIKYNDSISYKVSSDIIDIYDYTIIEK